MAEKFKVGDKVQVKYLGDEWIDATVVEIRKVSAQRADEVREYYPDIKAGDDMLICDGGGDTRAFLPAHDSIRRVEEPEEFSPALRHDMPATKPLAVKKPSPRKP